MESSKKTTTLKFLDLKTKFSFIQIWYFRRIRVCSHIFQILLRSITESSDEQAKIDLQKNKCTLGNELRYETSSIRIRCMWDSIIDYHDIAEPMYKTWEHDGYGIEKETKQ